MTQQDTPPAPPEADVIRRARMAARMTADEAAAAVRAAGGKISATYWRDVERGRGARRGQPVPARASDSLLAQMAHAVGVTPAQLRDAARGHPDGAERARAVERAADVLEEIRRREGAPGIPRSPDDAFHPLLADSRMEPVTRFYDEIAARVGKITMQAPPGTLPPARIAGSLVFDQPGEEWLAALWDQYAGLTSPFTGKTWTMDDVAVTVAGQWWQAAQRENPGEHRAGLQRLKFSQPPWPARRRWRDGRHVKAEAKREGCGGQ